MGLKESAALELVKFPAGRSFKPHGLSVIEVDGTQRIY